MRLPIWSEILREINEEQKKGNSAGSCDTVRRKYISRLQRLTGRNVILYATKWTNPGAIPPDFITISEEDVQGMMEVFYGLDGSAGLDLVVHSPGGSAEATEGLVKYLRSKFSDIRVVVPQAAMSAATMFACSGNRILMGKHSSLGPIDPQMILQMGLGTQAVPAQAILDQFKKAQEECKDPEKLTSWLPMLEQYGPALLIQCEEALALSRTLVSEWLETYMFEGDADKHAKAENIATLLADHKYYKSHGRHISRADAIEMGLKVEKLEDDTKLQDAVLSVFHSTTLTFTNTLAVKIIENHLGRSYVNLLSMLPPGSPPQEGPHRKGKR
jgi:hypothetical protein